MEIKRITYNWFQVNGGEDYYEREIGKTYGDIVCTKIDEHRAQGEGDKWYYDIHYSDESIVKIFNPNTVYYKNETL